MKKYPLILKVEKSMNLLNNFKHYKEIFYPDQGDYK